MNGRSVMSTKGGSLRHRINRRSFLWGTGGAALGLPFLEGVPERSAWAQAEEPVFLFLIVSANGIVANKFFPERGQFTTESLQSAGKATSALADHAANLLMVDGVNYPGNLTNCGHAQGLVQALTGVGPQGGGQSTQASDISADMVVSNELNPQGTDALTLYSGAKGYIAERISFSGAGVARPAERNPYNIYRNLIGLVGNGADGSTDPGEVTGTANELLVRETSINDLIRDDLESLLARSDLSAADRQRLDAHLTAVRELEMGMTEVATVGCEEAGLNVSAIEAMENLRFSSNGHMIEDIVKLHSELVALAFACNANRVATLQWGDGTDATVYDVPSNSRKWGFHHISHRMQSDGQSGNDPTALVAHEEIDALRMQTFKHTIDQFAARGLLDKAAVVWTSHVSDGPSHSFRNIPYVIAGSAGGVLKQGEYVAGGGASNAALLTTLIRATGASGSVGNGGSLDAILA